MMKLSIIVPVYNMAGEGKLQFCLNSLIRQTIKDYEIIAVDDASTDQSLSILYEYESHYPHIIKVIAQSENKRQGGAKNTGIKAASGKWLGFIDSDDWIAPDMYEKLLKKAEETGADVVGCDYNLVKEQTMKVGKIVQNNHDNQTGVLEKEQYKKLILHPGSMVIKIYKREIILDNDLWFPEKIFYEDNCASPLWMLHSKQFEKVNEPLYYYYQHDASTVHTISEERCRDRLRACQLFTEECQKRGFFGEYKKEIEYRFVELYLKNTLFTIMQGKQKVRITFLKKMADTVKKEFPDFMKNPYYLEKTDAEEQRLLRYFIKSERFFVIYYRLLYFYRALRCKMKKNML